MTKTTTLGVTPVNTEFQVVTVQSDSMRYMKKPCRQCPWKKSSTGIFPAQAFRISAITSYDMATHVFGCHSSKPEKPTLCAGGLLRGSTHNLSVRLMQIRGAVDLTSVSDGGHQLYDNYRQMAIANGVKEDDPCLERSRTDV